MPSYIYRRSQGEISVSRPFVSAFQQRFASLGSGDAKPVLQQRVQGSSFKSDGAVDARRGLQGVIFVGSDDHPGLKRAIMEVLPEAYWQRCYVHFLRNALDYLPRKGGDDCLTELRWLYSRRDAGEARRDLAAWLLRWQEKYPKLCAWVEENIEETLTFYRLPREHHKHLAEDQYARADQPGAQTPHPCHPNLS